MRALTRKRMQQFALLALACLLFGFLDALKSYGSSYHNGRFYADWPEVLKFDLLGWAAWLFLAPFGVWLSGRLQASAIGAVGKGAIYAVSALLCAAVRTVFPFAGWWVVFGDTDWFGSFVQQRWYVLLSDFLAALVVFSLVLALAHARLYYRRYRDEDLKRSMLEAQLAQAQVRALRMQLNPHFLFNTLNSISSLLMEDTAAAQQMIARLGTFLRLTLDGSTEQEVPLRREIEFIRCYLDIERVRFGQRLSSELDVPADALDVTVPNLILQPLVENAIQHGLAPRATPGWIRITARPMDGYLRLEVQDNGVGLRDVGRNGGKGIGLANIRDRLRRLYGEQHGFEIHNPQEGGLLVAVRVPLRSCRA